MTRVKLDQTIGLARWRRFAPLALILLIAVCDLLPNHEVSGGLSFSSKGFGYFLPTAYAVCPDQNIQNNHIPRYEQNLDYIQSTDYNRNCSYSYSADDNVSDNKSEGKRNGTSRRRAAIEIIRSAKRSFGNKITQREVQFSQIFNNKRKFFFSKKEKQSSLQETTRLVGGANLNVEAGEDPQQLSSQSLSSPSDVSLDANQGRKSIFGSILPKSKNFFVSEESEALRRNAQQILVLMQKISSQAGPSIIAVLSLLYNNGKKDEISLVTLYTLALLGASCGFHLFLHFITLGYALGVTLPLIVALPFYQKQYELPLPTVLHSLITIFWGVRLFSFLAIREYVTWPALHQKVVEVQVKMKIPFASKILCWFLYSFFYVTLAASCWSRLLQSSLSSSTSTWGLLGYAGLLLQLVGLSLETVADLQKNSFKSRYRHSWCNIGVWKYSTHPNYLGEGMFWWGTYLAHGFHSPLPSFLATVGLVIILYVLKGSAKSLSSKQKEKYGQEVDFYQFQRTHNVFGPKQIWTRQQPVEGADPIPTEAMAHNFDGPVPVSNDVKTQEIIQ